MQYNTTNNKIILEHLSNNKDLILSVDDIMFYFKTQNINIGISTIYRILDKFVLNGKVKKYVTSDSKKAMYQYIDSIDNCKQHFHFRCNECKKVLHVDCNNVIDIVEHIINKHNFYIDLSQTIFYGTCSSCKGGK